MFSLQTIRGEWPRDGLMREERQETPTFGLAVIRISKKTVLSYWEEEVEVKQEEGWRGTFDLCTTENTNIDFLRSIRARTGKEGWGKWRKKPGQMGGQWGEKATALFQHEKIQHIKKSEQKSIKKMLKINSVSRMCVV